MLSSSETAEVIAFSKSHGISVFNILKVIWAVLIGHYCQREKLIIVHPVSVRIKQFSGLKGSFINVLPFAMDLNTTMLNQIANENESWEQRRINRFAPTSSIIQRLNEYSQDVRGENIFQVVIAQTDLRVKAPSFGENNSTAQSRLTPNIGSAMLLLEYQYFNGLIHYHINYLSPAMNDALVDQMGQHFKTILQSAIWNPEQQFSKMQYISDKTIVTSGNEISTTAEFYQHIGSRWPRKRLCIGQ